MNGAGMKLDQIDEEEFADRSSIDSDGEAGKQVLNNRGGGNQNGVQTSMSYSHSYSSRVISSQRTYHDKRLKGDSSSDSSQNHREVIERHLGRRSGEEERSSSSGEDRKLEEESRRRRGGEEA